MRKLIVSTIISLDGYFEGPGGNALVLPMDASFDEYNLELLRAADVVLLGGTSYGMFSGFWPGVADDPSFSATNREFSRRYNAVDKVIISDSATPPAKGHPWAANTLCRAKTLSLAVTCRCGCGQAARWYSLRMPPRMRRRRTASLISTTTSGSWSGGRRSRL